PPFVSQPDPHSFPTRRSSDLESRRVEEEVLHHYEERGPLVRLETVRRHQRLQFGLLVEAAARAEEEGDESADDALAVPVVVLFEDRKSTTSELQSRSDLVCRL